MTPSRLIKSLLDTVIVNRPWKYDLSISLSLYQIYDSLYEERERLRERERERAFLVKKKGGVTGWLSG